MKATELRIGNYVFLNDPKRPILHSDTYFIKRIERSSRRDNSNGYIWVESIYNSQSSWYCNLRHVKPIALNIIWLKSFGITKNERPEWLNQLKCYCIVCDNLKYLKGSELEVLNPINYVHQLQNLHFALTGKDKNKIR